MTLWRTGLLIGVLAFCGAGWSAFFWYAAAGVRSSMGLLAVLFALVSAGLMAHYRDRLNGRLATAYLALAAIGNLAGAGIIVGSDRLWQLGLLPALEQNWHHVVIGTLAVVLAFIAWTRARLPSSPAHVPSDVKGLQVEPAPPARTAIDEPDWGALQELVASSPLPEIRNKQLQILRRLDELDDVDAMRRVVRQEAIRLATDLRAEEQEANEEDVLTQAANFLEWGAQKLPELAELDVSDALMAKAIADIRAQHDRVENRFVDLAALRAIHPIDRDTAIAKSEARASAARDALPLLEAHGMRLSEELVAAEDALAPFRSVTGFQVVEREDGSFVTFEGNGRRDALQRAFRDGPAVEVEVRVFCFDDPQTRATIRRRVERVRRWKGVQEEFSDQR
jgi:hypothetical protein